MKKLITTALFIGTLLFEANAQTIPTSTVTGSLKINDSLNVTNNIQTSGDMSATGNITATGEVTAQDTMRAQKDLIVDGNAKIAGAITVVGSTNLLGGLTVSGLNQATALTDPCNLMAMVVEGTTGKVLTVSAAAAVHLEDLVSAGPCPPGGSSATPIVPFTWQVTGNHVGNNYRWIGTYENYDFNIRTNSIQRMVVKNNGQVFIGAKKPMNAPYNTAALGVDGMFVTREIYVCDQVSAGWADYVFKKDYKLMPLQKVQNYVTKNSHLPNIPNAEDIKTNGQNVGKLQVLQMEKIEEIYLYLFDITQKLDKLTKENEALKKLIYEKK